MDSTMVPEADVDGGFDGASVEAAETLWACLPRVRKWTSLATHEKALVIHTLARHRIQSEGRTGAGEALREASSNLAQQAGALIVATDGQSKIRNERQRVLNAVKDVAAALSQSTAGEDGHEH